jgi:hypothetical protein
MAILLLNKHRHLSLGPHSRVTDNLCRILLQYGRSKEAALWLNFASFASLELLLELISLRASILLGLILLCDILFDRIVI